MINTPQRQAFIMKSRFASLTLAALLILVLVPRAVVAQRVRVLPVWERHFTSLTNIQYHASADLISVDTVLADGNTRKVFLDAWTGTLVGIANVQSEFCYVDSARERTIWTIFGLAGRVTPFTSDSVIKDLWVFTDVFNIYPEYMTALSSSAADLHYFYESGGGVFGRYGEDQAMVFIGSTADSVEGWHWTETGRNTNPSISRSGLLCGGTDSGQHISYQTGKLVRTWNKVTYAGPGGYRSINLRNQQFAWLDDINNILIASDGLYGIIRSDSVRVPDSAHFLRPLPAGGWFWQAPFSDWTYVLACKPDSSKVSIVSLVTDSVVAECIPTSGHVSLIYSDVRRNYILTYDATSRVLSGFVVDTTLIPSQVISSVANDGAEVSTGEGAQDLGLWPNPTSDIATALLMPGTLYVSISSVHGVQKVYPVSPDDLQCTVLLHDLPAGVYIVAVVCPTGSRKQYLHIIR